MDMENLWIPFGFSTLLAPAPSHAGPLSLERGRPTTARASTTYLRIASSPRSSLWQQISCQRWRGQITALCGGSWAALSFPAPNLLPSVPATCQSLQASSRNYPASLRRWTKNHVRLSRGRLYLDLKKRRRGGRIWTHLELWASLVKNGYWHQTLLFQREKRQRL